MAPISALLEHFDFYEDSPEVHQVIWDLFNQAVEATPYLKQHRDLVEKEALGYGERPFHQFWKLLVDDMPENFRFLEIGVFQGQVLSLVGLCAKKASKKGTIVGVTPLSTASDHAGDHPDIDYLVGIRRLHSTFDLPSPKILHGFSYDPRIRFLAKESGPYDAVYVDGCHDYEVALEDLRDYSPMVKSGGYLIVDDCGNDLNLPPTLMKGWKGIPQVTEAVKADWQQFEQGFHEVFAVGHIRVFRKV